MTRSTVLAVACALTAFPLALSAQTPAAKFVDSARTEINTAVLANDTTRLGNAVVLLDRALVAFPNDPYLLHYRGYANYRRAIDRFRAGNIQGASPFIERGIADLERSGDKLPWPETWSLLSAMNAFRIAVDPSLRRELAPELGGITARAAQLGPNNPRVLLMQAMGIEKTPPEYGGGVDQARAVLERALKAFENDKPAPLAPSWGREEAVAMQKRIAGSPR